MGFRGSWANTHRATCRFHLPRGRLRPQPRLTPWEVQTVTTTTGLLRWAESKRQLLPRLAQFWQASDSRYVEPFAGSACLFFHLQPREAVLGDLNTDLMATYRTVRSSPDAVAARLSEMPSADEAFYYKMSDEVTSPLSAPDRA